MPGAPHITPQDPSLSTTYNAPASQTEHSTRPSIRRNLFSAHLSRRPVSNTTTSLFGSASPTQQNAQSHHDVFSSGPTLHPTRRMMDLQESYDPNASPPNRTSSPSTSSNLFPRESIIAVHPATGRPVLPIIPTLPPRLRLSDDDDEDDEEAEEGAEEEARRRHEYLNFSRPYSQSPSRSRNFGLSSDFDFDPDMDLDTADTGFMGTSQGQNGIRSFIDPLDSEENGRGRERIEHLLGEMMNRQRARARTLNNSGISTNQSASQAALAAMSNTSRSARLSKARSLKADNSSNRQEVQKSSDESALGGIGTTLEPAEKDELMGLIMTSLRRKLQQAEDEGWMYGGAEGLGGIGIGNHGDGGVYE